MIRPNLQQSRRGLHPTHIHDDDDAPVTYLLNNWGIKYGQDGQAKEEMQMTKI